MIQISPAILVADKQSLASQLETYYDFARQIDIDINLAGDHFAGEPTVSPATIIPYLANSEIRYGIHLMVSQPWPVMEYLITKTRKDTKLSFYIHQEANFEPVLQHQAELRYPIGMTVKAESALKPISFYQRFPEVQLMTIETGRQGNQFQPHVLQKVNQLRQGGYQGLISVDGSVNSQTAQLIRGYDLDRVSVGSFLAKSQNPQQTYNELNELLNAR
jgi:pentose-5-phosphate-3-epimerase